MYIKFPKEDARLVNDPIDNNIVLEFMTLETLNDILQQCKDIKTSILEGEK